MATSTKKVKTPTIDYKIDSKLIDSLYKIRMKLKNNVNYGSRIAGLCLLGEKDGMIDDYVPILSNMGCWDAPQVSYAKFEKAFLKMVKKDRAVMGMALIRPGTYDASLPNDFRSNIRNWKHAFKDIFNTIWIVVSAQEVIPYGVSKDSANRIQFRECREKIFIDPEHSKMLKIAEIRRKMRNLHPKDTFGMRKHLEKLAKTIEKGTSGVQILKNIEIEKEVIESKRRERLEKLKKQREARKAREERAKKLFQEQEEKRKKKENQVKAGMKDTTDLGGGYFLIKQKNGKEILWKK